MKHYFLFFFTILWATNSFGQDEKVSEKTDSLKFSKEKVTNENSDDKKNVETKDYKFILKIQLGLTSVFLEASPNYQYWPELSKLSSDTAVLHMEGTKDISDLQLTVVPNALFDSIVIEQKFENALTLKNKDGDFQHLKKWWSIDSNWQTIEINWPFKIIPYNTLHAGKTKESLMSDFKQIKKEVLKYTADAASIKEATTIAELPLIFWASKYIIRVSIKTGNKTILKYLIIEDELGG